MSLAKGQYSESYEHFMSALKTEPDNCAVSGFFLAPETLG